MFGDIQAAREVLSESEPRKIRNIGNHIKHYAHSEWVEKCDENINEGVQAKFNQNMIAKKYLLKTAVKVIGEASKNKKWGTGIHISNKNALNSESWDGDNLMGAILMRIRNELQESEARETVQVMDMLLSETSKVSNSTEQQPHGMSNQEGKEIWEEGVSETAVQPDAEVTGQTGFDNMVESGIHLEKFENRECEKCQWWSKRNRDGGWSVSWIEVCWAKQ